MYEWKLVLRIYIFQWVWIETLFQDKVILSHLFKQLIYKQFTFVTV